jgi:threonyl-tRNA synthetase
MIIPVNLSIHEAYALEVKNALKGFRLELDDRNEKMGYKIRGAQTEKIPYTLVLGDTEMQERSVTYRKFGSQDQTTVSLDDFISHMRILNNK